jgi:hypothetical protein
MVEPRTERWCNSSSHHEQGTPVCCFGHYLGSLWVGFLLSFYMCEKSNDPIPSRHLSLARHDLLDISFSESLDPGVFEAFGWWNS